MIDVAGTTATVNVSSASFSNTGTIDVASGNTFELSNADDTTASAFGGTFNAASGTIELYSSTLNNTGATLSIGSGSGIGTFYLNGNSVVSGGIIKDGGSGLQSSGGTLNDVKVEGALNLQGGSLGIDDGTTFTGAGGTGAGSIATSGYLYVYDSQTLDDDTITLTGGTLQQYTSYAAYVANGSVYPTETLTLGSKLVIDASGGNISTGGYSNTSSIVNDGEIEDQSSSLSISPTAFTNNGTVDAQGTIIYVQSATFTDTGVLQAEGGGEVYLYNGDDYKSFV